MRDDFAELGVTIEGKDEETEGEEVIYVWDISWDSFTAFLDCATQWRAVAGMTGLVRLGLDYSAVDVVLRRRNAEPGVFDDLRVMELEALSVFGIVASEDAD